MSSIADWQRALAARGFDVGAADGLWGPRTYAASMAALGGASVHQAMAAVTAQPKAARPINEVVIHCTATREGVPFTAADIRAWHKGQGWKDIGYHYVVRLDGLVEAGRPEAQIGAHVVGRNIGTIGVVYVGGVAADGKTAKDTRTPAQRAALTALVEALAAKYPIAKVSGHNEYAAKACPSFDVRTDPLGSIV